MLVTGLKMWHLRPESVFFPKNNFYNVVTTSAMLTYMALSHCLTSFCDFSVPPHSDVLLLFGEIDCREGLVVSVEKCRYKDLEEAAQARFPIWTDAAVPWAHVF